MRFLHWLYPGLYIKRWLFLVILGVILLSCGLSVILHSSVAGLVENTIREMVIYTLGKNGETLGGIFFAIVGFTLIIFGLRGAIGSFLRAVFPNHLKKQVHSVTYRQQLRRGPRIVVIGGGTGLSVLLRGLKNYTANTTAIVSVTDDGGSSGELRGQFGILPPGDLRNCLVALADTEPVMEKIFDYRFNQGKGLEGHNLGNLLITAMTELSGSFETAINEISKVLAIRGRVIPSTLDNVVLAAELQDGTMVMGETIISASNKPIKKVYAIPNNPSPMPGALEAISDADVIVLGPGSLYTSVIPNLLVPGIAETIKKAKGLKLYVCNVMTQPGESDNYRASDHLKALYRHSMPDLVDYIIVNNEKVPEFYLHKYALEGARPVEIDREKIQKKKIGIIEAPLIHESDYIRHDSNKLAQLIIKLVLEKKETNPFNLFVDRYLFNAGVEKEKK